MSASLVGSEMCIRDRRDAGRPPQRPFGALSGCPAAPRWAPYYGREHSDSCLLYTSDAADDM
eukprot:14348518-Alexandrium_andersonii.AAC.1